MDFFFWGGGGAYFCPYFTCGLFFVSVLIYFDEIDS
jgi:hypothetical protein